MFENTLHTQTAKRINYRTNYRIVEKVKKSRLPHCHENVTILFVFSEEISLATITNVIY